LRLLHLQSNPELSVRPLELWFLRFDGETMPLETSIKAQLSPSEKKRLTSIQSKHKKKEYLLSRLLMRHALSQLFKKPENEWQFIECQNSLPKIRNLPEGICFSLSHSKNNICFAIYNGPIGVDIESTDKKRNYLEQAELFMNRDEISTLKENEVEQADNFYRIWCGKEAYYKALPLAEQATFSILEVSVPELVKHNGDWLLFEGKTDQFRLSVVTKIKPSSINYNNIPGLPSLKIV